MDPVSAGAFMGVASLASSIGKVVQDASSAATAAKAADYNAAVLKQQGLSATNTAASNMGMSIRRSAADLGEQSAAFSQANIGTGGSVQDVERQSARDARMDALNIWYGGELERYQSFNAAAAEKYSAAVYRSNAKTALTYGLGTSLLTSAAAGYGTTKGITLGSLGSGSGGGII